MSGQPARSDRLRGSVALVFGAGSPGEHVSVGQATAVAYACAGASVVVGDRDANNAARTERLVAAQGGACMAVGADVTDPASVAAAVRTAVARFGRIDVLHNNVGAPVAKPFADYTEQDWLAGLHLNCVGAVNTIQAALPHLLERRGAIVNVSSVAGIRFTGLRYAVYSAAKAALNQLTVAVALEFADQGLRANAILPGMLDTDMGRALGDANQRAERSPTKAQGTVWDVANAAVYLASPEASYVNGHLLVVDGGLSARC